MTPENIPAQAGNSFPDIGSRLTPDGTGATFFSSNDGANRCGNRTFAIRFLSCPGTAAEKDGELLSGLSCRHLTGGHLMSNEEKYLIMTFPNTPSVMEAEGVLKERFSVTIMPIPRELTASCGLAVRF
ncbi:MAG: DUF3343 domain-containing protein, partial [Lachnospiraceae bacterium]|nr:DUF3343 domain-containing protein [Lachnospiraceae bacterium]